MTLNLVILAAGIGLFIWELFFTGEKRVIEDTPTSKVRSVAMGFAELKGAAKPRVMLISPYSNFPCIYYRYVVEVESHNGKHRTRRVVKEGESGSSFYLDDGTGKILVCPKRAEFTLSNRVEAGSYPEIVTEWCIMAGDQLYVAGTVGKMRDFSGPEFDQSAHYRQELKRCQDMLADVDLKPQDWTGPQAAEQARERLRKQILDLETKIQAAAQAVDESLAEEIAVGKGSAESTFIISDMSEEQLTRRMSSATGFGLAVSGCMVLYALWALAQG